MNGHAGGATRVTARFIPPRLLSQSEFSGSQGFCYRHCHRVKLDELSLVECFLWSEDKFNEKTEGSAIRRIGYESWLRNTAIALGNAPTSATVINALNQRQEHPSSLVREHVNWALAQHA